MFREFARRFIQVYAIKKFKKLPPISYGKYSAMQQYQNPVLVEIVAKKKGCMLCDLAIGILEEVSPEFENGILTWEVVDVSNRDGLRRFDELTNVCGRRPAVPSIVINNRIAFDNIPDMEALAEAVRSASK